MKRVVTAVLVVGLLAWLAPAVQAQTPGEVFHKVAPSVVVIRAKGREISARGESRFAETGSGVLITPDGYALTNDHVVAASANGVHAALPDGRALGARLVGRDPATDLALLQVEGSALPFAHLEAERLARPGQLGVAIGNPLGFDSTVTAGSSPRRAAHCAACTGA